MNYDNVIAEYSAQVNELCAKYESLLFEDVHGPLLRQLPELSERGGTVLDIGCGSGRDAAWFAQHGYDVVAVEAAPTMLADAKRRHPELNINWQQDSLPDLKKTLRLGLSFDLILLSAVWMHVAPDDRSRVFRKLVSLLKPGGMVAISLRHGPHQNVKFVHPVSVQELESLAIQRGLTLSLVSTGVDRLGRPDVRWETVILRLPDDGTGALPLLRHIIVNDNKSSTYKLDCSEHSCV